MDTFMGYIECGLFLGISFFKIRFKSTKSNLFRAFCDSNSSAFSTLVFPPSMVTLLNHKKLGVGEGAPLGEYFGAEFDAAGQIQQHFQHLPLQPTIQVAPCAVLANGPFLLRGIKHVSSDACDAQAPATGHSQQGA